jgi:D-3-phosphoglycerate dehydrogenase
MKIVLVGDLIIERGWCLEELKRIAEKYNSEYAAIDWETENVEGLRVKNMKIEKQGPSAVDPPKQLCDLVKTAEILIVHFCPVSAKLIDAALRLKVIGTLRTGLSNIDVKYAAQKEIPVVNLPGRLADAVSDFTIGLIFSLVRGIVQSNNALRAGRWTKNFESNENFIELSGKTVGLIGFGEIGKKVAHKLANFDVKLYAYDPFVPREVMEGLGIEKAELSDLLSASDIVSIHTSLTDSSKGLIGKKELSLLKRKSYLINTARAEVIDKNALYEALREGTIAGAALDVFWEEPINAQDPFLKLENVVVTPHISGTLKESLLKSFSRLNKRMEPFYQRLSANGKGAKP